MLLSQKKNGFTVPIVAIFVLLFLIVPLVFWYANKDGRETVKGVATATEEKTGIYLQVTSDFGTWEMLEYLCKNRETCLLGLDTGKKWEAMGGGFPTTQTATITFSDILKDYEYIKVYVKPGWGSQGRLFNIKSDSNNGQFEVVKIDKTSVALIPTSLVEKGVYTYIVFTDN